MKQFVVFFVDEAAVGMTRVEASDALPLRRWCSINTLVAGCMP